MTTDAFPLAAQVGSALRRALDDTPIGADLPRGDPWDLHSALERFIPALLERFAPGWTREALDGLFVTRAWRTAADTGELYGWALLLTDVGVTHFFLRLSITPGGRAISRYDLRFGEAGGGRSGIAHPLGKAHRIETLHPGIEELPWTYWVTREHG